MGSGHERVPMRDFVDGGFLKYIERGWSEGASVSPP